MAKNLIQYLLSFACYKLDFVTPFLIFFTITGYRNKKANARAIGEMNEDKVAEGITKLGHGHGHGQAQAVGLDCQLARQFVCQD